MKGMWSRLRERKLFQWAAAYLAVALAAMELLGMVGDSFGWPAAVGRSVVVLAAFGFLVVVVLAWYHGERGRQRVSPGEMVAVGALAVAAALTVRVVGPGAAAEAQPPAGLFPETAGATRLGILPFDNLSPSGDEDAYLAAALREEITTQVMKVGALAVVRSDSRFRSVASFPLAAMADSLRVRYLLGGSVLRDGDLVRVTVWIADAVEGQEVWREAFDGEFSAQSLVDIQTSVAFGVARELEASLAPSEVSRISRRYTFDDDAYDLYLRGVEISARGAAQFWPQVSEVMEGVVTLDSLFAPAWSLLALAYVSQGNFFLMPAEEAFPLAEAAVARALALDESLAHAHVAKGHIHFAWDRDWEAAAREVDRALELSPTSDQAYYLQAFIEQGRGNFDTALQAARRMVELAPVGGAQIRFSARMHHIARRYEEALGLFRRSMIHSPEARGVHLYLALTHEQLGMTREAAEDLRDFAMADPRFRDRADLLTDRYTAGGMAGVWRLWLEWMGAQDDPRPSEMAIPHARLAQADSAVFWLEQGAEARDSWLLQLNDPLWDPVRSHPGFSRLQENRGRPASAGAEEGRRD